MKDLLNENDNGQLNIKLSKIIKQLQLIRTNLDTFEAHDMSNIRSMISNIEKTIDRSSTGNMKTNQSLNNV